MNIVRACFMVTTLALLFINFPINAQSLPKVDLPTNTNENIVLDSKTDIDLRTVEMNQFRPIVNMLFNGAAFCQGSYIFFYHESLSSVGLLRAIGARPLEWQPLVSAALVAGNDSEMLSKLLKKIVDVANTRKIDISNIIVEYAQERDKTLKTLANSHYISTTDPAESDIFWKRFSKGQGGCNELSLILNRLLEINLTSDPNTYVPVPPAPKK